MRYEDRVELSSQLTEVIKDYLSPNLCTGTGKEFRGRREELVRLMTRVSAVILYDGLPASEQMFRAKTLENTALRAAEGLAHHVWPSGE